MRSLRQHLLTFCAIVSVVTAYHKHSATSMGTRPHIGVVAAADRRLLGRTVVIAGRRYHVEDRCARGFDVWLPSRGACVRWGRKRMNVRVMRGRRR